MRTEWRWSCHWKTLWVQWCPHRLEEFILLPLDGREFLEYIFKSTCTVTMAEGESLGDVMGHLTHFYLQEQLWNKLFWKMKDNWSQERFILDVGGHWDILELSFWFPQHKGDRWLTLTFVGVIHTHWFKILKWILLSTIISPNFWKGVVEVGPNWSP